ncbi:rhomboid family intramembrane serine protease [Mucilaginibacter terrenus]|uniref:Rhomboid family intramembrane serine protease n=2 Tax=Mucilaginibacter terrenus TaxID=2482727 RepID=A0A3E2NWI8_9SPHI|nr:rhomboid family intramembrane serine protease [Mucilaginibacter terrenus]
MVLAGLGFMSFDAQDLYQWGANQRAAVLAGQWWRLLSSTFLHGGAMHLFGNTYGLLIVGAMVEQYIGRVRLFVAYFACGLVASIASIWWHPDTVSVGASGAIFGLCGVLLALLITNKTDGAFKTGGLIFIGLYAGINLLFGLKGNVDNAAHVGGLVGGIIVGLIMSAFVKPPKQSKRKPTKRAASVKKAPEETDPNDKTKPDP